MFWKNTGHPSSKNLFWKLVIEDLLTNTLHVAFSGSQKANNTFLSLFLVNKSVLCLSSPVRTLMTYIKRQLSGLIQKAEWHSHREIKVKVMGQARFTAGLIN